MPEKILTHHGYCVVCHEPSMVVGIPLDGYRRWKAGQHVQDALPELSASDREILISGTHSDCWDRLWGDMDLS